MRSSGNQQSCEPSTESITPSKVFPEEKKTDQETIQCVEGNETITISELLTSDHDCPLSSMLHLPLSKGGTDTPTTSSNSTGAVALHTPGEQFIPAHYPYPQEALKRPDEEAMVMSGTLNFENQELMAIQNTCSPHADRHTSYFPNHRLFEMKEPSFQTCEVEIKPDSARKATEAVKNEKQYATRMGRVTLPIKFGENSRKRQRTNSDGVKTASQRKMAHLDKEKERRLRQTKCYDYLRSLVPCSGNQKTDKANMLEVTVSYLSYIKETLGTNMDVIDKNFLDDIEQNKESLD